MEHRTQELPTVKTKESVIVFGKIQLSLGPRMTRMKKTKISA